MFLFSKTTKAVDHCKTSFHRKGGFGVCNVCIWSQAHTKHWPGAVCFDCLGNTGWYLRTRSTEVTGWACRPLPGWFPGLFLLPVVSSTHLCSQCFGARAFFFLMVLLVPHQNLCMLWWCRQYSDNTLACTNAVSVRVVFRRTMAEGRWW